MGCPRPPTTPYGQQQSSTTMNVVNLEFLSTAQISDALALDALCFGGLWKESGYQREIDSPNSDLIIVTTPDSRPEQELGGKRSSPQPHVGQYVEHLGQPVLTDVPPNHPDSEACMMLAMSCLWAIVDEAHITMVAVHPDARQQGFGKLLMWALLHCAHIRGMKRATLEVRASNQGAIALYEQFGFRAVGTRKKYYQDTNEDALIFWLGGIQNPAFGEHLQRWRCSITRQLHRNGWHIHQELASSIILNQKSHD